MYPPHHLGGYELTWHAAVEHMRKAGHDVRVLTSDFRAERPDESIPEGDHVNRTLQWYWRDHDFPRIGPLARRRLERHNRAIFEAQLEEFEPELIAWWSMGGMSMSLLDRARKHGVPALAVVYDDWPLYGPEVSRTPNVDLNRAARLWSFCSESQRRRSQRVLTDVRTRIDYPGIDPDLFSERPPRSAWGWQLLYCGRIDPRKGIDAAIETLTHLPEARLRIDGGGDETVGAELRDLAERLEVADRVVFSHSDRAALPNLYVEADVVLFPVRWEEPFGLVPLEAMAIGTPVIASGRGGPGEYLKDNRNAIVTEPEPEPLAAAIQRLANEDLLRARLRSGGLETAGQFSAQRYFEAIEEAHEEALEG
jgi:glycosyltransferase involved in cell wall biosynthesis